MARLMTSRNRYVPDEVAPPGDTLAEVLETLGMSQAELAERMGRPKKTINEIVRGKAEITPDTALQFERVLSISIDFWLSLEKNYRAFVARGAEELRLKEATDWIKTFPAREMMRRGWIKKVHGDTAILRELLSFFGAATPDACDAVNANMVPVFRRSSRVQPSPGATAAWLRRGELEARELACNPFDRNAFLACLPDIRRLTNAEPEVIMDQTRAVCARVGVAVVFVPGTRNMTASGAARWLSREKACIQLSLRHKSNDHLWFTFFHEAAHLLFHAKFGSFVDWTDEGSDSDANEDEANVFSRNYLIPPDAFASFIKTYKNALTRPAIERFAHSVGIAAGVVVGRLQNEKLLHYSEFTELKEWFEWNESEE